MTIWIVVFIAICIIIAITQMWYTHTYIKQLERHQEEIEKTYEHYKQKW